jgi:hypothetical protein
MDKNKKGRYPNAVSIDVPIYHYGHIRNKASMNDKLKRVGKYWNKKIPDFVSYNIDPKAIKSFSGNHPAIMKIWLKGNAEQVFNPDPNYKITQREKRHRFLTFFEKLINKDLTKKHFRSITHD